MLELPDAILKLSFLSFEPFDFCWRESEVSMVRLEIDGRRKFSVGFELRVALRSVTSAAAIHEVV
jgi:hypothetical protein